VSEDRPLQEPGSRPGRGNAVAPGGWPALLNWVALDKSEGFVKRHFFAAMLGSTVTVGVVEDQSSETFTVMNQLSAVRSANHRYGLVLRP
jgi:hypothetical protein